MTFDQIFDKNLRQSDSVYQLIESQRLNLLSQEAASGTKKEKILLIAVYIGHGIWRESSMHTFNEAQRRILNLESGLRTVSEMPNVYVISFFDSCRQDLDSAANKSKSNTNIKRQTASNMIMVYREAPSLKRPCSCENLPDVPDLITILSEHKKKHNNRLYPTEAVKNLSTRGFEVEVHGFVMPK